MPWSESRAADAGHLCNARTTEVSTSRPLANPAHRGPTTVEVVKTEEKGSDVNLATYLLADAFRGDCDVQVVITNDSDLCEPIRIVKDELGMPVGIINPHAARKRSNALRGTFFKEIRPATLAHCQFPTTLKDSVGVFTKPATW